MDNIEFYHQFLHFCMRETRKPTLKKKNFEKLIKNKNYNIFNTHKKPKQKY